MITSIDNIPIYPNVTLEFAQLNIIIGDNETRAAKMMIMAHIMRAIPKDTKRLKEAAHITAYMKDDSIFYRCLINPEINLDNQELREIAETLVESAAKGEQVFVTTYSLFLLREIYLVHGGKYPDVHVQYFNAHGDGTLSQAESWDDIGDVAMLDEEIMQANRYMNFENHLETRAEVPDLN